MILPSSHRSLGYRVRSLAVAAIVPITVCSGAFAALVTPNGNPTGPNPAVAGNGTATLDLPATYRVAGNCPWLLPALAAEGFGTYAGVAAKPGANLWTINLIALNGNLSVGTYAPWVNIDPFITQGTLGPDNRGNVGGDGGVNFGVSYVPAAMTSTVLGANNPATTVTHWIQVIETDDPSGFGTANGTNVNAPAGYTNYIDNSLAPTTVGGQPTSPFYDAGGEANGTDFIDIPARALTLTSPITDWQAQDFLSEWLPTNANNPALGGTIDIYDGIWYGFNVVPEPGALTLLGACTIAFLRRRGRTG